VLVMFMTLLVLPSLAPLPLRMRCIRIVARRSHISRSINEDTTLSELSKPDCRIDSTARNLGWIHRAQLKMEEL
jgi:hypothetical protein